jgi:hypothetical protein
MKTRIYAWIALAAFTAAPSAFAADKYKEKVVPVQGKIIAALVSGNTVYELRPNAKSKEIADRLKTRVGDDGVKLTGEVFDEGNGRKTLEVHTIEN